MDIRYLKNKNSIKIWPYLDDVSQAIMSYSEKSLSKNTNTVVNIDFSQVKRINSSSATIALTKLIRLIKKTQNNAFKIVMPEDGTVRDFLIGSGFLHILTNRIISEKSIEFGSISIEDQIKPYIFFDEINKIRKTSFPIFNLKYNKDNDRASVNEFMDWITDLLFAKLSNYKIEINTLLSILNEIAKNSQDHTEDDSFFGFDIIEFENSNTGELCFSFTDLGIGIADHIRNSLRRRESLFDNDDDEYKHLRKDVYKHISFTDAYHIAFTYYSGSKKARNKGVGMSMIRDGRKHINLDLSVWDEKSSLLVPDITSHSELRKNAYDTGNKLDFCYYGRLKF